MLGRQHVPWDVDMTIACGGTTVQPGRHDRRRRATGCWSSRPALLREVVADADRAGAEEEFIARMVAEGHRVDGLFPMNAGWRRGTAHDEAERS